MTHDPQIDSFDITQVANTVREMNRTAQQVRGLVECCPTDPNIDSAAQRAHVLLPLAMEALSELALAFMTSDDVSDDEDDMGPEPDAYMDPATCASSPAAEPASEDSTVRAMAALKAEMAKPTKPAPKKRGRPKKAKK